MHYEQMSDFEINKAVAEVLGFKIVSRSKEAVVVKTGDHELGICTDRRDYCNNPDDAWPVIVENDIMLNPNCADSLWKAEQGFRVHPIGFYDVATCYSKNPLRAAMIVFLMMKDDSDEI